ncbi:MAG: uroporphyrinogen decarboxylase family protein [Spirochaetota bacterium]
MTSRERILGAIHRTPIDRIPMVDTSYWPETIARWEHEGLAPGSDVRALLGLDRIKHIYFDCGFGFPETTIEENNEHRIYTDSCGRTIQAWKNSSSTPVTLTHPMKSIADWSIIRKHIVVDHAKRLGNALTSDFTAAVTRGDFVALVPRDPAWVFIEYLLGFEEGLTALMCEPEAAARIMHEYADLMLAVLSDIMRIEKPHADALWFYSDLCFKNGMLFSPAVYRSIVQPVHRRFRAFCDEHGLAMILHCDGDVREFIPLLIETGFDVIQPLEARAGNDVRKFKAAYGGDITFFGNIDADIVAAGDHAAIEEEVRTKVTTAAVGGGYIYHIDHSVPPTVSFSDYRFLIECVMKYGSRSA